MIIGLPVKLTLLVHSLVLSVVFLLTPTRTAPVRTSPAGEQDFVNRAQYNFISECVRRADLRERSSVLALLVRSAEACLQMNNYDSAMLLVGVLCDSSVHRLRKTWEMVRKRHLLSHARSFLLSSYPRLLS